MCTLYLDHQGATLHRRAGRLTLTADNTLLQEIPLEQVDRVLVYGQIQITTAALGSLLERGVPMTLLNRRGWLRGHVAPECGGQVRRRARQYTVMQNPALALPLARTLVGAKVRNQARLLRRWGIPAAADRVRCLLEEVEPACDTAILRGVEGNAARLFFEAFPRLLSDTPFSFPGRRRRPATDPVNALLSLGYTLLLGELRSALYGYGLDPFAGFFHASDGGQPACALDLIEPLRCLVDRLVMRLIHAKRLTPDEFQYSDNECRLADGSRGTVYRAWEKLLAEKVMWRGAHRKVRQIIHAQAAQLAGHLDDAKRPFQPFLLTEMGK